MLYEFGNCALDTAKRQLTRGGDGVPLAPKTFDLLLLLVESGGRALSKAEVMQAVWPDTFVEEANLSFQVSTLRKALGADGARWIETVPKHGYRFAGPVAPRKEVAPALRPWYTWVVFAGALAVAAGLALFLVRNRPTGSGYVHGAAVPLTTYPGIQSQPSLSPDGSQVAFSWNGPNEDNFDIYVKLVGPGEPVRLTKNPARDVAPAWSPDGRQIAFLRFLSRQQASIIVIPALGGGVESKVTDVRFPIIRRDFTLAWTADARQIAVSGRFRDDEPWGIWLVPLNGSPARRLTNASAARRAFDSSPALSPDGRTLAFIRVLSMTDNYLYVQRLTDGSAPEGDPVPVTSDHVRIDSAAWVNDRLLAYSVGLPAQRRLRLIEVVSGRAFGQPQTPEFGDGAIGVSIARNGSLVYGRAFEDVNLWRFDLAGRERPQRLAASTYQNWTPAWSHDGRKIAFASTRSGLEEIWVADADGAHPIQITRMGSGRATNPRWSPDDSRLVFNWWNPRSGSDLYTVDVNDGSVLRLTDDPRDEVEPSWSRDGHWIYFGFNRTFGFSRTNRLEVYRIPAAGGALVQITKNGGLHAEESTDGKWLYYSKDADSPSSIWKVPRDGGEETLLIDGLSYSLDFIPVEKGIYFGSGVRGPEGRAVVEFYDFATAERKVVTSIDKPYSYGLALSPDRRWLVQSLIDHVSSNLMLVENFR